MKKLILSLLLFCASALAQFTYPPVVVYFEPGSGTGASHSFYFTSWNYSGGASVQYIWARFGETINGCNVLFDIPGNRVFLLSDDGANWGAGLIMGTNATLENSKCKFNASTVYKVVSGNYATGYVTLDFKPAFAGAHPTWSWTNNTAGQNSGWVPVNSTGWTVPGLQPPGGFTIWPTSSTDTTRTFTVQFSDPAGTANVDYVRIGLGGWSPGCMVLVRPNWNLIYLINSINNDWGPGATIGSTNNLENPHCRVNTNPTSLYFINSNTLAINLSVTALSSFAGNGVTSAFVNGLNGLTGEAANLGTWNPVIVQPTIVYDSAVASHYNYPSEAATDNYTGQPTFLPTSLSPAPAVAIAGNPAALHPGDAFVVSVRWGKPNSQVWGTETDEPTEVDCTNPANAQQCVVYNFSQALGTTDSTGYLLYTGHVNAVNPVAGIHTLKIFVGTVPGTLPYDGANQIGAVSYWGYASAANSPAPPNFSLVKTSQGVKRVERLAQVQAAPASSRYKQNGDRWEYTFDIDTRAAKFINVGDDRGYSGVAGPDNPNFQDQHGFDADGAGWTVTDNSVRSQHSIFTLVSDWLPGPVSILLSGGMPKTDGNEFPTYADALALISATSINATATRKNVIGPAIPPLHNEKSLRHLIRNWVDQGNAFLIPLTADGADLLAGLDAIETASDYERAAVDCIRAALK